MTPPAARRPRALAVLDGIGLLAFAAASVAALVRLGVPAAPWPALVAAALAGVALADLASGIVHWACDRFFSPRTPLVGELLIRPFRAHHAEPEAITRHGPLELHGANALGAAPLMAAVAWWADASRGGAWSAVLLVAAASGLVAAAATNQVHLWAHARSVPAPVAWLQRRGLLLRPEAHARHHAGDHRRAFCITTGWCNPLLDRTALLPRLEALLRRQPSLRQARAR